MCGIVGYITKKPLASGKDLIASMLDKIKHRGPDDSGIYINSDMNCGLGHVRLSIIDLSSDGHQPMTNEEGSLYLVFNGEIYNHLELRSELEKSGHTFKSKTDTEVILHGYEEYGTKILSKLNGIFAFAICDLERSQIFVARDQLGVKPLYFAETEDGIYFSSESKAFAECNNLSKGLDYCCINQHMAYVWSPSPLTVFKSVRKLAPGEAMTLSGGKIDLRWKWYHLPYNGNYRKDDSFESLSKELAERLELAVKRQLMADVPLGAFLSGGLDSSAIVAMMRKLQPDKNIKCYSIGFKDTKAMDDGPQDLPYAEKVAKHLKLDLTTIEVTPDDLINRIEELVYCLDEPLADPAPINAMFIAERARKDGVKVLMSGAGGDDIFSGYRRHLALKTEALWSWLPYCARKGIKRFVASHADSRNPWLRRMKKLFGNCDKSGDERIAGYYQWSSDELRKGLFAEKNRAEAFKSPTDIYLLDALKTISPKTEPVDKMLFLDSAFFLPDHNLNYTDKTCMKYGVEARVPLLDTELVEFAAQIPTKYKQTLTCGKAIFKKAMEPYLPYDVIYRPKTGFGAPLRQWVLKDLKSYIDEQLSETNINKIGIFDSPTVRQLIEDNQQGRVDGSFTIFSILCIHLFLKTFNA